MYDSPGLCLMTHVCYSLILPLKTPSAYALHIATYVHMVVEHAIINTDTLHIWAKQGFLMGYPYAYEQPTCIHVVHTHMGFPYAYGTAHTYIGKNLYKMEHTANKTVRYSIKAVSINFDYGAN